MRAIAALEIQGRVGKAFRPLRFLDSCACTTPFSFQILVDGPLGESPVAVTWTIDPRQRGSRRPS